MPLAGGFVGGAGVVVLGAGGVGASVKVGFLLTRSSTKVHGGGSRVGGGGTREGGVQGFLCKTVFTLGW